MLNNSDFVHDTFSNRLETFEGTIVEVQRNIAKEAIEKKQEYNNNPKVVRK